MSYRPILNNPILNYSPYKFPSFQPGVSSQYPAFSPTPAIPSTQAGISTQVGPSTPAGPAVPADPKLIGPGIWIIIHQKARRAIDEPSKIEFVNLMKMLAETFPCEKCRKHINEYLQANPFEPYWNLTNRQGEIIGLFKWSWNFHNTVNIRLDKPYLDFETAWNLFGEKGITLCSGGCHEESSKESTERVPVNTKLLHSLRPTLFKSK